MSIARSTTLAPPGVTKLGPSVWTYSLPAIATCPGRTAACALACYATRGRYRMQSIRDSLERRQQWRRDADFVGRVIRDIALLGVSAIRVHVSGDFDSPEYAEAWREIMHRCRRTTFWFYTRSWRDAATGGEAPAFTAVFRAMAALRHVHPWYSADRETGPPPRRSKTRRIRVAYMAEDVDDRPAFPADLVFLVRKPAAPTRRIAGVEVCPYEDGVARRRRLTCGSCRKCLDRSHTLRPRWSPD